MDTIIAMVDAGSIAAVSSVITLPEVLPQPIRAGNVRLEQEYRDILLHSGNFFLLPVTVQIANIAADLRARYNLRTPDALHVATAIEAGCDGFLTNDSGIKCVTDIRILVLDELELGPKAEDAAT